MTTRKNLYLDLYVLQTVPPANINYGADGAPKSAIYGGVKRTRVSSQSWKHAMREYFAENAQKNAVRTVNMPTLLAKELKKLDVTLDDEEALDKASDILKTAGISITKDHTTKTILNCSQGQMFNLAKYATTAGKLDKKEMKAILNDDRSLDLELFGRMVAEQPDLSITAVAQVAHALSVNATLPELDFYTVGDDLKSAETVGNVKLGQAEFSAPTLYRYANVNVRQMNADLGKEATLQGVADFVKSFVLSMPTAKQNAYGNKTLPGYVMAVLRPDTTINLVNGYEVPVEADENGVMGAAVKQLKKTYRNAQKLTDTPLLKVALSFDEAYDDQASADNLNDLINQITQKVAGVITDENADA